MCASHSTMMRFPSQASGFGHNCRMFGYCFPHRFQTTFSTVWIFSKIGVTSLSVVKFEFIIVSSVKSFYPVVQYSLFNDKPSRAMGPLSGVLFCAKFIAVPFKRHCQMCTQYNRDKLFLDSQKTQIPCSSGPVCLFSV